MRQDKEKVFILRRGGKSYREIQKITGISRGTLCDWFKDEEWSRHIKRSNDSKQIKISIVRLAKLNEGRRVFLNKKYAEVEEIAKKEFTRFKDHTLFIAGLMLYAGEGDKSTKGVVRLANIDFDIHRIFINFIKNFMKVSMKDIRLSVLLYPDLDIEICKYKWSKELGIPLANFHKPQVIQGRHKTKRLHFGVGSTIFSSSFSKRKLLLWIELAKNELSKRKNIEAGVI